MAQKTVEMVHPDLPKDHPDLPRVVSERSFKNVWSKRGWKLAPKNTKKED